MAKLGRLDILVNNAGLTKDNLFMVMKDEQWDDVIAVNLTSTFMLMRAATRHMLRSKTGYGRIINISSISGIVGNPGQGNYAASKAGMIGMTKSLAREVANRGITANCIAPGFIKTAMTDALNEKQVAEISQHIPAQRFGTPDDIAAGVPLSGERRSRLHDRPDAAHQRRHDDDMRRAPPHAFTADFLPNSGLFRAPAAGQGQGDVLTSLVFLLRSLRKSPNDRCTCDVGRPDP